jgi:anti-sigma B factor antagonist
VQPFRLRSITAGADCAVLHVRGEVDMYTAPQLREHVIDLLTTGTRHIIADLREVDFLDSTGLGALVGSLKRLREQGGSLKLVTGTDRIRQLFRLTGLVRVFAVHTSIPEATAGDQHWRAALADEGLSTEEWCRKHGLL